MKKSLLSFLSITSGFIVFGLSLALLVINVNTKNNQTFIINSQAALTDATVSLRPGAGSFSFDKTIDRKLAVVLETEKNISTLSLQISFDPQKVSVSSQTEDAKIFDSEFSVNVDNKKGIVSLFASNSRPLAVSSPITTLLVRPLQKGETKFFIQAGATSQEQSLSTKLNDAVLTFN